MTEEVEASAADTEAEETPPETLTELAPPRETFPGDCPQEKLDRLRPICANAEQKYQLVITSLRQIKESESIVQRFHAREGKLTPLDVEQAKKQFHKAKQSYIHAGNEINEGIKQVNDLAQTYPEDLLLKETYKTYLAKLLASLETRNLPEHMVSWLAAANFHFERQEPKLDEREQQRGLTVEKKKEELLESEARYVNMLETRYLKRQFQNRLRQGENKSAIVGHVGALLKRDPDDLHNREVALDVYPRLEAAYSALDRAKDYEDFLRAILDRSPDDSGARCALARSRVARGAVDEGIAELRRVLDGDPGHRDARVELGRILLAEHRHTDAVKELSELLEVLDEPRSGPAR